MKINGSCRNLFFLSALALVYGNFFGCTSLPIKEVQETKVEGSEKSDAQSSDLMRKNNRESLLKDIIAADHDFEEKEHVVIPAEAEERVQKWVDYFTLTDRTRFETFLARGAVYREQVNRILDEIGVPRAIYYLAMIESGYVTHATSRQAAVGPWQFIKATGRRYGLKVNRFVDDRRDIVASTRAAAKYLKDLYSEFGSWYLALAGYNAGEGRIRRVIRQNGSNDFWHLISISKLPKETSNYVPKFLAAVIVGENAEKFGFSPPSHMPFPIVAKVAIPSSVHLFEVADMSGIDYAQLKLVNAHLKYEVTPNNSGDYEIYAPMSAVQPILAARDRFKRTQIVDRPIKRTTRTLKLVKSSLKAKEKSTTKLVASKGRVLASIKKAKNKNRKLLKEKKSQAKNDQKVAIKGSV